MNLENKKTINESSAKFIVNKIRCINARIGCMEEQLSELKSDMQQIEQTLEIVREDEDETMDEILEQSMIAAKEISRKRMQKFDRLIDIFKAPFAQQGAQS